MEKQLTFISARKLAKWVIPLTEINIILQLAATGISLYTTFLLNGYFLTNTNQMIFYSLMGFAVALLDIFCFIILSMIYLCWINRAYKNILALGATGLKYTPGKSVAGFLIPFLNLTRPPAVLQEIWKASDPDHHISTWSSAPASPTIRVWWALCLLSVFFTGLAAIYLMSETINLLMGTVMTVLATISFTAAAFFTIIIVKAIDQRQTKKWQKSK